jgi:branched-chain amino acid transport system permease protein
LIFDIFLVEAIINGILFGGVLALLALGLNLVFGVVDVVWICYAELVMVGMYFIFWGYTHFGLPLVICVIIAILAVSLLGFLIHNFVIRPILSAPPINQLLVTGGLLFFMQSFATLLFTGDFRNLGLHLPILELAEMYISFSRLIAFVTALLAMLALYFFLKLTYLGTAIRAISQDREVIVLMGVNAKRVYLAASTLGGSLAGLGAALLILQYDVHPLIGISFGPITFMICVLGGLGNLIGGFIAAFVMSQFISLGGFFLDSEWGYVIAFVFFIIMMFLRPEGLMGKRS